MAGLGLLQTNQIPQHLLVEKSEAHLTVAAVHGNVVESAVKAQQVWQDHDWDELGDVQPHIVREVHGQEDGGVIEQNVAIYE